MIVHKRTMGVVYRVWTGDSRLSPTGQLEPVMKEVCLSDYPWLDPEEWWEVTDRVLIRRILRGYPELRPLVDEDGQLTGVEPIKTEDAPPAGSAAEEARARGYAGRRSLRPKGMMPFLVKR